MPTDLESDPMSSRVPTPVAAALGLVPSVLSGVRRLPAKAATLPLLATTSALTAVESFKKQYDELAERGEQIVGQWRGTSFDDLEDKVEDRLAGTRLAKPYDVVEDALEDATAKAGAVVSKLARKKPPAPEVADPEAPKGEATPSAPTGTVERVETAATSDVVEIVEDVVELVDAPAVTAHDDLPLPDYDHMTLGSLRGRLRSLTLEQLVQVRDYEKAHAHRLPVVTLLDNRIAKLATDAGAEPSPGAGAEPVLPAAPKKTGKAQITSRAKTTPPRTKVRTT
jgi:hypothetical protein